jgi:hypothetical protein
LPWRCYGRKPSRCLKPKQRRGAANPRYIRDLIRQDMQDRAVALNILEGLDDLKHGRLSSKSIRDFKNQD